MANYEEVRFKLTNKQLSNSKSAAKHKTRKILTITKTFNLKNYFVSCC